MKLKSFKKSKVFEGFDKRIPRKELKDLNLFERKREIGSKGDKNSEG